MTASPSLGTPSRILKARPGPGRVAAARLADTLPRPADPQSHGVWVADDTRCLLQGRLRDTVSPGLPPKAWDRVARCWHRLATYRPRYRLTAVPVGRPGAVVAHARRYRPDLAPVGDPQHTDLVSDVALSVVRAAGGTAPPERWQVLDLAGQVVEVDGLWWAWLTSPGWHDYDADRARQPTLADWPVWWQNLTGRVLGDGHARRR